MKSRKISIRRENKTLKQIFVGIENYFFFSRASFGKFFLSFNELAHVSLFFCMLTQVKQLFSQSLNAPRENVFLLQKKKLHSNSMKQSQCHVRALSNFHRKRFVKHHVDRDTWKRNEWNVWSTISFVLNCAMECRSVGSLYKLCRSMSFQSKNEWGAPRSMIALINSH